MTRNMTLYVKDIVQNMEDAEEFIQGFSYEAFCFRQKDFKCCRKGHRGHWRGR